MRMARTDTDELLARFEAWAETVDVDEITVEDLSDLRALAMAADHVARAEHDVADLVRAAREHGRSWADIGRALGTSRQGARQRFGSDNRSAREPRSAGARDK
jgi:hypothetical protein